MSDSSDTGSGQSYSLFLIWVKSSLVNGFSREVWVFSIWFASILLTIAEESFYVKKYPVLKKWWTLLLTLHYLLLSWIWRLYYAHLTDHTKTYQIHHLWQLFEIRIVFKNLRSCPILFLRYTKVAKSWPISSFSFLAKLYTLSNKC